MLTTTDHSKFDPSMYAKEQERTSLALFKLLQASQQKEADIQRWLDKVEKSVEFA
jgi:hypothetical protein